MILYFVLWAFLCLTVIAEKVPVKTNPLRYVDSRRLMWAALLVLCFLAACRGDGIGKDTHEYILFYHRISKMNGLWKVIQSTSMEPGYAALNYLLSRMSSNPQLLIAVTSAFSFFAVGHFISRHSEFPTLSVYFFFVLLIFDFFLSGIRQTLALACVLLGFNCLSERKNLGALLWLVLAGLFHRTAWLMLGVWLLLKIPDRKRFATVSVLLLLLTAVLWQPLLRVLLSVVDRYQNYEGGSYLESGSKLSIFLYFLVYVLMLLAGEFVGKRILLPSAEKSEEAEMLFRLSFLLLVVCAASYIAPIISRLLRYFMCFLVVYYPNQLMRKDKANRRILLVSSVLLFAAYGFTIHLLRTPEWYTTYPYAFFWSAR